MIPAVAALTIAASCTGVQERDPRARERAVASCSDEQTLARIALSDPDASVAEEAVSRMDAQDQAGLAEVASHALSVEVRQHAVLRLTDPVLQARLVPGARMTSPRLLMFLQSAEARAALVMGAWAGTEHDALLRNLDPEAADVILRRSKDPVLVQAVQARLFHSARDRATLRALFLRLPPGPERTKAVQRLDDQELLADLALHGQDAALRAAAATRLSEWRAVWHVRAETTDPGVTTPLNARVASFGLVCPPPIAAISRLAVPNAAPDEDEATLLARARAGGTADDRLSAIRALTRQDELFALATSDPLPVVRAAAAATLTDTSLIRNVLAREQDEGVRTAAVTRLTDPDTLSALAQHDPSVYVRRAAMCHSRDRAVWEDRAAHETDPELRGLAVRVLARVSAGR
jgi:hypothetical protein